MVGLAAGDGKRRRRSTTPSRERRAIEVGRAFAEIIRDEPAVRELWVTADTEEPGVHLWLITDPIDWDKIHDLYGVPVDTLFERYPKGDFELHILNPPNHIGEIHGSLRPDAEQIPLRAD
jgi:hypothetical protein